MANNQNVFEEAKISDSELAKRKVSNYSNRPNQKSAYGPGLTPVQTKNIFDAQAEYLAERHNKLIEVLGGVGVAEGERRKTEEQRRKTEEQRQIAELGAVGNRYDHDLGRVVDENGDEVENPSAGRVGAEIDRKAHEAERLTAEEQRQIAELGAVGNRYDHDLGRVVDSEGNVVDNFVAGRVGAELERKIKINEMKDLIGNMGIALNKIIDIQNNLIGGGS